MSDVISVKNLVRKFGNFVAVDSISFDVARGSIFAFLGPNGAGKSTTISCLTTTSAFDGEIVIDGHIVGRDDNAIRREIGVVFQNSLLDPTLTVYDNLRTRASFYGLDKDDIKTRIGEVSQLIGLDEVLRKRYGKLSGGQQRRADIARALIHQPRILFLDEPTTGLDPQGRKIVWDTVYALQKKLDLTVFLTTHYMEETERADMVFVIDHGKIIANGTPQKMRAKFSENQLRLVGRDEKLADDLRAAGVEFSQQYDRMTINVTDFREALKLLKKYESQLKDFEFVHGNMDDVFLRLTGKNLREGDKK